MSAERKATCRCGWDGEGEHPCHYRGYACKKPAKQRFYGPRLVSLAGMQPKCEVSETWACDECWEEFQALLGEHRPNLPDNHLNPNKADDASRCGMSEDNKVNEAALPGKLLLLWQESDGAPQSRLYIGGREVGMITRIEVASPGVADGVPTLKEIGPILAGDVSVTWTQVGVPVYEGPVSGPVESPSQGWDTPFQAWLRARPAMLISRFGSVIPRKLQRVSVKALRREWDARNRAFMAHGIGIDEPCVGWVSEQGGE